MSNVCVLSKSTLTKKRPRKNRQNKVNLVFDEEERRDYLKGFRKRKNERRLKAKEEMDLRLKEEKKRVKEERKNALMTMYYTTKDIPEVEHLVKSEVYELPNHTVTIASITDVDFQGVDNLLLGQNKLDVMKNECEIQENIKNHDTSDDEKKVNKMSEQVQFGNINRMLKRKSLSHMKKSKVMEMTRRLQQKKDRKKFHREKKAVFKKREKQSKIKSSRGSK